MREMSRRYTPRLARLVSRVSGRTSASATSSSGSSGSSGISSASLLIFFRGVRLFHTGDAGRQREHVERIVDPPVTANLEVQVPAGGAARAADGRDLVSGGDDVAHSHEVPVVVGVDGHEAIVVLDLHHATVARLHSA